VWGHVQYRNLGSADALPYTAARPHPDRARACQRCMGGGTGSPGCRLQVPRAREAVVGVGEIPGHVRPSLQKVAFRGQLAFFPRPLIRGGYTLARRKRETMRPNPNRWRLCIAARAACASTHLHLAPGGGETQTHTHMRQAKSRNTAFHRLDLLNHLQHQEQQHRLPFELLNLNLLQYTLLAHLALHAKLLQLNALYLKGGVCVRTRLCCSCVLTADMA
jgi:hypothetical protein